MISVCKSCNSNKIVYKTTEGGEREREKRVTKYTKVKTQPICIYQLSHRDGMIKTGLQSRCDKMSFFQMTKTSRYLTQKLLFEG